MHMFDNCQPRLIKLSLDNIICQHKPSKYEYPRRGRNSPYVFNLGWRSIWVFDRGIERSTTENSIWFCCSKSVYVIYLLLEMQLVIMWKSLPAGCSMWVDRFCWNRLEMLDDEFKVWRTEWVWCYHLIHMNKNIKIFSSNPITSVKMPEWNNFAKTYLKMTHISKNYCYVLQLWPEVSSIWRCTFS
jgi:hypothetical protein